ncbi:hypothetical protein B7P43_G07245 [Cryptotermes secundus]|uniref:Uncharacterized protein n=1 Tax=Cryptotermes secundus TaxID=105785 RepID=A0A2J7RC12_9NEOP|nr:hypothetical protein B7P43_G07245 [Cryptotermes secundus]
MEQATSSTVNSSSDTFDTALNVNQFSNENYVENNSITSKTKFQTREKIFNSGFCFEGDTVAYGEKGMLLLNEKVDSKFFDGIVAEPVRVRHSENKSLVQFWSEKNYLLEDASSCSTPEKRLVAHDCLPQKLSSKYTQTEHGLAFAGDCKNFLVSRSNRDVKDYLQQANKTKSGNRNTPRTRQLNLKRKNSEIAGPAPKRARIMKPNSGSLKYSEIIVEGRGSITSYVCSDMLKVNDNFCLETEESTCVRPGQPFTNISGVGFKSCFASLMSSSVCDKSSSMSFSTAGYSVTHSSDLSSQSKRDPLTTSMLPGKHPNRSLNELDGTWTDVTQSSEPLLCESLGSILRLSTEMMDSREIDYVVNNLMKDSAAKTLSLSCIEEVSKNTDKELLPGDIKDISVGLDTMVDVLQEIDDFLNDLMEDHSLKPLSVSQTEQDDKDSDKEKLQGDIKDNFLILEPEVDILREIDDFLNDFR